MMDQQYRRGQFPSQVLTQSASQVSQTQPTHLDNLIERFFKSNRPISKSQSPPPSLSPQSSHQFNRVSSHQSEKAQHYPSPSQISLKKFRYQGAFLKRIDIPLYYFSDSSSEEEQEQETDKPIQDSKNSVNQIKSGIETRNHNQQTTFAEPNSITTPYQQLLSERNAHLPDNRQLEKLNSLNGDLKKEQSNRFYTRQISSRPPSSWKQNPTTYEANSRQTYSLNELLSTKANSALESRPRDCLGFRETDKASLSNPDIQWSPTFDPFEHRMRQFFQAHYVPEQRENPKQLDKDFLTESSSAFKPYDSISLSTGISEQTHQSSKHNSIQITPFHNESIALNKADIRNSIEQENESLDDDDDDDDSEDLEELKQLALIAQQISQPKRMMIPFRPQEKITTDHSDSNANTLPNTSTKQKYTPLNLSQILSQLKGPDAFELFQKRRGTFIKSPELRKQRNLEPSRNAGNVSSALNMPLLPLQRDPKILNQNILLNNKNNTKQRSLNCYEMSRSPSPNTRKPSQSHSRSLSPIDTSRKQLLNSNHANSKRRKQLKKDPFNIESSESSCNESSENSSLGGFINDNEEEEDDYSIGCEGQVNRFKRDNRKSNRISNKKLTQHKSISEQPKQQISQNQQNISSKNKRLVKASEIPDEEGSQENSSKSPSPSLFTCTICLVQDNPQKMQRETGKIDCGHTFCFSCIETWSKITNQCPMCRSEFWRITQQKPNSRAPTVYWVKRRKQKINEEDYIDEAQAIQDEENNLHDTGYPVDAKCYRCLSSERDNLLLVCDVCDENFCHTFCDELINDTVVPEGRWSCHGCRC